MKRRDLAGCIITDASGHVLLIHRNTQRLTQWELPGGKCEPGENAADTAVREVAEEIKVEARVIKKVGETTFVDDGTEWYYTWFFAEITDGEPVIGEPDRYDGIGYVDITSPELDRGTVSINIRNLIEQIESGQVEWPPSYV